MEKNPAARHEIHGMAQKSQKLRKSQGISRHIRILSPALSEYLKTSRTAAWTPVLADDVQCHGAKPLFHVDGFASNQHGFPEFMLLINYTVTDVWHAASFQQFSCGLHMERTSLLLGACFVCGSRQLGNTMMLETDQTQQFPLDLVVPKIPSSLVFFATMPALAASFKVLTNSSPARPNSETWTTTTKKSLEERWIHHLWDQIFG